MIQFDFGGLVVELKPSVVLIGKQSVEVFWIDFDGCAACQRNSHKYGEIAVAPVNRHRDGDGGAVIGGLQKRSSAGVDDFAVLCVRRAEGDDFGGRLRACGSRKNEEREEEFHVNATSCQFQTGLLAPRFIGLATEYVYPASCFHRIQRKVWAMGRIQEKKWNDL